LTPNDYVINQYDPDMPQEIPVIKIRPDDSLEGFRDLSKFIQQAKDMEEEERRIKLGLPLDDPEPETDATSSPSADVIKVQPENEEERK